MAFPFLGSALGRLVMNSERISNYLEPLMVSAEEAKPFLRPVKIAEEAVPAAAKEAIGGASELVRATEQLSGLNRTVVFGLKYGDYNPVISMAIQGAAISSGMGAFNAFLGGKKQWDNYHWYIGAREVLVGGMLGAVFGYVKGGALSGSWNPLTPFKTMEEMTKFNRMNMYGVIRNGGQLEVAGLSNFERASIGMRGNRFLSTAYNSLSMGAVTSVGQAWAGYGDHGARNLLFGAGRANRSGGTYLGEKDHGRY